MRGQLLAAWCMQEGGHWSGDKCTGGMISCTSLRCSCYNHHNNAGDTETLVTAVSSAPQHAAPGEIILNYRALSLHSEKLLKVMLLSN